MNCLVLTFGACIRYFKLYFEDEFIVLKDASCFRMIRQGIAIKVSDLLVLSFESFNQFFVR